MIRLRMILSRGDNCLLLWNMSKDPVEIEFPKDGSVAVETKGFPNGIVVVKPDQTMCLSLNTQIVETVEKPKP